MKKSNTAEIQLSEQRQHYIKVTRNLRWAVIGLVLLTFPPKLATYPILLAALTLAVVYNLLWYWPRFSQRPRLGSLWAMNLVDNGFILLLVSLSGGIGSPYYIVFVLTATSVVLWYGWKSLALVAPFHIVVAGIFWLFPGNLVVNITAIRRATVAVFIILANGYLTERITWVNRLERHTLEQARQSTETEKQRLLTLIHSMGEGVIATGKDGRVLLYNGAALDLLNTNQDLTGKKLNKAMPLEKEATDEAEDNQTVNLLEIAKEKPGIVRSQKYILPISSNEKINLDITLSPIISPTSSSDVEGGYILIARDITKEKNLDEARDEFISVTSHELRTPVAIAEANLSTALLPDYAPDNDKTLELMEQAHENVVFLGKLIEDLNVLAKAERGALDIEFESIEPQPFLEELAENFRPQAGEKALQLQVDVEENTPAVTTSPDMLHEILQNYLTNAIKYTEEGSVTLRAYPDQETGGIIFCVEDTGIGIAASDKQHMFEKFYRSEDYRTRQHGGTGLGLYISEKLAERLGGRVWFESQLNQGSIFYIALPKAPGTPQDAQKVREAEVKKFMESM